MMKKTYIAPAAELILLSPAENIAASGADNQQAQIWWGKKTHSQGGTVTGSAVTATNQAVWGEDGRITTK